MKRRVFLQGLGATTALPLVPVPGTAASHDAATDPTRIPQPAVFAQQAYFDFDGSGTAYAPPVANRSTVEYRASLGEEEFLRRHWFS